VTLKYIEMTSQKCQPKPGQKIHGPVRMDRFKMTERFFFDTYPKWVFSKMGLS
jgi:hypothetical protein